MPRTFTLPEKMDDHVRAQLLAKSWDEHSATEYEGHILFPETIHRRKSDGSVESIDVMMRVPRAPDLRKARLEGRAYAAEQGLDPRLDKDMCDDIETLHILSLAIRNRTSPYEQWEPFVKELEKNYDTSSMVQAWAKLDAMTTVVDPRPQDLGPEEALVLLAKLAKEKNLGPLAVYGSDAQSTFITSMAAQLLSFLDQQFSSEQSEPSTPES